MHRQHVIGCEAADDILFGRRRRPLQTSAPADPNANHPIGGGLPSPSLFSSDITESADFHYIGGGNGSAGHMARHYSGAVALDGNPNHYRRGNPNQSGGKGSRHRGKTVGHLTTDNAILDAVDRCVGFLEGHNINVIPLDTDEIEEGKSNAIEGMQYACRIL